LPPASFGATGLAGEAAESEVIPAPEDTGALDCELPPFTCAIARAAYAASPATTIAADLNDAPLPGAKLGTRSGSCGDHDNNYNGGDGGFKPQWATIFPREGLGI